MKTHNEAREIERALARLMTDAQETLESKEKLERMKAIMADIYRAQLAPPHETFMRGVLTGFITARNEVRNEFLRGPRRRIKR